MARRWNNRAKARHRTNMSKGKRRPSRIGSEFMLAKGRGRYRWGGRKKEKIQKKVKKKSTSSRKMERKKDRGCDAVLGELGQLTGGQMLINPEVP